MHDRRTLRELLIAAHPLSSRGRRCYWSVRASCRAGSSTQTTLASHGSCSSPFERHSAESNASDSPVTSASSSASRLTQSSLAAMTSSYDDSTCREAEFNRIDRVDAAGRSLGIDLPRHCYERDKWEMKEWLRAQSVTRLISHSNGE